MEKLERIYRNQLLIICKGINLIVIKNYKDYNNE